MMKRRPTRLEFAIAAAATGISCATGTGVPVAVRVSSVPDTVLGVAGCEVEWAATASDTAAQISYVVTLAGKSFRLDTAGVFTHGSAEAGAFLDTTAVQVSWRLGGRAHRSGAVAVACGNTYDR